MDITRLYIGGSLLLAYLSYKKDIVLTPLIEYNHLYNESFLLFDSPSDTDAIFQHTKNCLRLFSYQVILR